MPCPGPQPILCIHKFMEPGPIEMQSSPVFITLSSIVTPMELCTCIPSVLGLPLGALILTFCIFTSLLCPIAMWIVWLLIDLKPLITTLFECIIVNDCIKTTSWIRYMHQKPLDIMTFLTSDKCNNEIYYCAMEVPWIHVDSCGLWFDNPRNHYLERQWFHLGLRAHWPYKTKSRIRNCQWRKYCGERRGCRRFGRWFYSGTAR